MGFGNCFSQIILWPSSVYCFSGCLILFVNREYCVVKLNIQYSVWCVGGHAGKSRFGNSNIYLDSLAPDD